MLTTRSQLGERYRVKFTFDTFNVTNSRSLTSVDQDNALSYGVPDLDYLKPHILPARFLWPWVGKV